MHSGNIENYNFIHGLHRNLISGKWFPLHPHTLGRPLTHDEMDYNLLYSQQTVAGWRIFGQNDDLTLSDNELRKSLIFWKISADDVDYARYVAAGYTVDQYIWITPTYDCNDFMVSSESTTDTSLNTICDAFVITLSSTSPTIDSCDIFGVNSQGATDTALLISSGSGSGGAGPVPTATEVPPTATPEPTATATPEPTATATPEPTATATPDPTATPTPTAPQEWNILLMSGGFSFNGLHWQTANNGGNYDNIPSNNISGFSFTNTLDNGLLDTTLIQNLLDDAYAFEQDPSIVTGPQLTVGAYGGATYFGPGIGQVQVGQQLYDGYSTNPYTQDSSSNYAAGAAQVSLIEGGNSYVQAPGGPRMGTENQEWQQNGGTIRVIAWDDNGIVTDVQDFTVPSTS